MSRDRVQRGPALAPDSSLDEALIRNGLAEIVPRKRRGRAPLALRLALLLLAILGVVGLPLLGVLLSLVVAVVIEVISTYRRRSSSLESSLVRPTLWERIRPPLYWTLAAGVGLVAILHAGEPLWAASLRGGFVWLCLRAIADTVNHPERYASLDRFLQWLKRLEQHVGRIWGLWLSNVALALLLGFAVNIGAPGIWQSVGHTGWGRLFVFGAGIFVLAEIAFLRSSRSTVHAAVQETLQNWEAPKLWDLDRALKASLSALNTRYGKSRYADHLRERLRWKNVDNLVAHLGPTLEETLIRRVRWSTLVASASVFVVTFAFLVIAVFLIVPRDVMVNWVSPAVASEPEIVLAFDSFDELFTPAFAVRLMGLDWANLAQEPVPKIVFLEAAILVSLILFRAATDRTVLRIMANADRAAMQRSFLLATAYLTLVEQEFQHLYSGFVNRRLSRNGAARTLTLHNEVLLAPCAMARGGAYRAISGFSQLYGLPAQELTAQLVAIFSNDRSAHEWTATFVHSVWPALATEESRELDPRTYAAPGAFPEKFWIWSDDQLIDLSSFEEAQWYGRFVPHQEH